MKCLEGHLKKLAWLSPFLVSVALGAGSDYHYNLARLFPSEQTERVERAKVLERLDAFEHDESPLDSSAALLQRLTHYEEILRELRKHEAYVYLRAERDNGDREAAAADDQLIAAMGRADLAVQKTLSRVDETTLTRFMSADASLARYGYFVQAERRSSAHSSRGAEANAAVTQPTLSVLADSYKRLRERVSQPDAQSSSAESQFNATWRPFLENEDAFAALLVSVVTLRNGQARLQGFTNAPEKKYFDAHLTPNQVAAVLEEVGATDPSHLYLERLRQRAARRLDIPPGEVRTWQLQDAADKPAAIAFPDAIQLVLAAEKPMGREYARQYERLLDNESGRVEWCRSEHCDRTGFSFGFAGMDSGLFYGSYNGTTNAVRATAHEAGHAVHRQFMAEHQALAVYQSGPAFLFESFAIFNELLLLDHLHRSASTPIARDYYLRQFLDDALFQVYGSAGELALERAIYAGVADGSVRSAADLDRLASDVLPRFETAPGFDPAMKVAWARKRLYFTDPLYSTNYLFAGLLALNYFEKFEADPKSFSRRYVTLLKGGITDTPQRLLQTTLAIDLDDAPGLVKGATAVVTRRMKYLE
jgi:oligoendopeptidase F